MEKKLNRFSFTGISTFKNCPKAFEFKYIEEQPEAFTSIEAHMGTSVHTVLEWAYRQRQEGKEPGVVEALDQYKDAFWNSGEMERVKVIKTGITVNDYFEKGKTFVTYFFNTIFPSDTSDTLLIENMFLIPLTDEIDFKGVIDRVARGKDGIIRVIDYKTGKAGHPMDNLQLPSYAMYVFENNPDNEIQLCIEDLREQRTLTASFHREEVEGIRSALLGDIAQILEAAEFRTQPSILCLWCGYNHICPNPHEAVNGKPAETTPVFQLNGESNGEANSESNYPGMEEEPEACCPQCGGLLRRRNGKYGPFLGCSNFPECRYTLDLGTGGPGGIGRRVTPETEGKDICPECGSLLKERKGKFGAFIGCTGYPQCRFTREIRKD